METPPTLAMAVHRSASALGTDPLDDEQAIVDQGRSAMASEDLTAAIAAFAQHARRFPRGPSAPAREHLWTEACARLRRAHPQLDVPELERRCAGRP
jgi:hypothetical protein